MKKKNVFYDLQVARKVTEYKINNPCLYVFFMFARQNPVKIVIKLFYDL